LHKHGHTLGVELDVCGGGGLSCDCFDVSM